MLPFEKLISLVNLIRFSKQVQLTPQEMISATLKRQTDSLMPSCLQHGPGAWGSWSFLNEIRHLPGVECAPPPTQEPREPSPARGQSPPSATHTGALWGASSIPGASPPTAHPVRTAGDAASAARGGGGADGIGTRGFGGQAAVSSAAALEHRAPAAPLTTILHKGLGVPAVLTPELMPHDPGSPARGGTETLSPWSSFCRALGKRVPRLNPSPRACFVGTAPLAPEMHLGAPGSPGAELSRGRSRQ